MSKIFVVSRLGSPSTIFKAIVFVLIGAIFISIFGYYGFLIYLFIIVGGLFYFRIKRLESNKRRQRAFMRDVKKKRKVEMICSRWGDFYYINVFGIDLAADSNNPEDVKEMLFDVVRIIRAIEHKGKLPKGKLYSERVAYLVNKLGLDADTCRWLCESEVLSDIDFLVRMGFSREPRNMKEWVDVIQGRAKADGRIVYHESYIARVVNKIEALAEKIQVENIRAGGFKTVA